MRLFIFSNRTVGVIVRLEKEVLNVLSMHGKVLERKPASLQKHSVHHLTSALDSEQNQIRRKDIVNVIDGPHSGSLVEIRHLYRSFVFLHSRTHLENGGIFVCKSKQLRLAGGSKKASCSVGPMNQTRFMSPTIASPMHPSARRDGSTAQQGRDVKRVRNTIGNSIRIIRGPYKGYVGIIKDATQSTVRVELHTTCQTVFVNRTNIVDVGRPSRDGSFTPSASTPAYGGSQTPLYNGGNRTPLYSGPMTPGSRTPHYGTMTPQYDGDRTRLQHDAWDPSI